MSIQSNTLQSTPPQSRASQTDRLADVSTCGDVPVAVSPFAPISVREDASPAASGSALDSSRRTGVGTSVARQRQSREQAEPGLRAVVLELVNAAIDVARRAHAWQLERRHERELYDSLRRLDDCTLHDLGIDRGQIRSLVEELSAASATRSLPGCFSGGDQTHADLHRPTKPESEETTMGSLQLNGWPTPRYQTSTPRLLFGVAAFAMTAMTVGASVIVPATMDGGVDGITLAATTSPFGGTNFAADVAALRQLPRAATECTVSQPQKKATS